MNSKNITETLMVSSLQETDSIIQNYHMNGYKAILMTTFDRDCFITGKLLQQIDFPNIDSINRPKDNDKFLGQIV